MLAWGVLNKQTIIIICVSIMNIFAALTLTSVLQQQLQQRRYFIYSVGVPAMALNLNSKGQLISPLNCLCRACRVHARSYIRPLNSERCATTCRRVSKYAKSAHRMFIPTRTCLTLFRGGGGSNNYYVVSGEYRGEGNRISGRK